MAGDRPSLSSRLLQALVVAVAALTVLVASAGRLRISPTFLLVGCVVAALAALGRRHVDAAAGIGIATVAVIPIYWVRPVHLLPVVPTAAVIVSLILLPAALHALPRVRWTAIDVAFAAYTLLLLTSTLVVLGNGHRAGFAILGSVVLPYFVFRSLAVAASGRKAIAIGVAGSAVALSLVGISEQVTGKNPFFTIVHPQYLASIWAHPEHRFGVTRAEASFGHPISLGMYLLVAVVLALALARDGKHPAIGLVGGGVIIAALLATLSRGPIVAAVLAVALWVVARRRQLVGRDIVVLVLVAAGLFAVPAARDTVSGLAASTFGNTDEASTADYRVTLLQVARDPGQYSLLGHPPARVSGIPDSSSRERPQISSVDSEYILLYLTNGLLTLLPFLAIAGLLLVGLMRGGHSALDAAWLAGAVGVMIGLLTVALITQFFSIAFMVLGVAAAVTQRTETAPSTDRVSPTVYLRRGDAARSRSAQP